MHCPVCGREKMPGSWLCPVCEVPILKPRKPAYKAGGWEWIGAVACVLALALLPCVNPVRPENAFVGAVASVAGPALAFSAARDFRRWAKVVGGVCLCCWSLLYLAAGWPLLALFGYFAFILTFEHVVWRIKLARM